MTNGWFAPLDDEERQLLVSSWITGTAAFVATASGAPWAAPFVAAPLNILTKRFMQMWSGDENRPSRAFAVDGRECRVSYRRGGGVDLDATVLTGRRGVDARVVAGRFTAPTAGRRGPRAQDPVALVVTNSAWVSQRHGLVVPARYGEPYRIRLPRGRYDVTAYSFDPHGRPKVDPMRAIGKTRVSHSGPTDGSMVLKPRPTPVVDRTALRLLRSQAFASTPCPRCAKPLYLTFASCPYCGALLRPRPASESTAGSPRVVPRPRPGTGTTPTPSRVWLCWRCEKLNVSARGGTCAGCGARDLAGLLRTR